MRSPQTLAKLIVLLACISSVQHAIALDLEIVIGVKERQAATKPFCLSLARQKTPTSIEDQYRKGLCELYGIAGKTHRHLGLRWLRIAAKADYTEAEIALADYLQTQSDDQQSEALQWYAVAQAAHDARAIGRYEHLAQRIAARTITSEPKTEAPPDAIVNPTPAELKQLYGAGYHCHRMGMGERWCHDAVDGL